MFSPSVARANYILQLHAHPPLRVADVQRLSQERHRNATLNALETLTKQGLATLSRPHGHDLYAPDPSSRYAPAAYLHALLDLPIEACLRAAKVDPYRVSAVYVYGSVARGDATPDSDLDLLVVGRADERALLRAFEPIEAALGRAVDVTLLSDAELEQRLADADPFAASAVSGVKVYGT